MNERASAWFAAAVLTVISIAFMAAPEATARQDIITFLGVPTLEHAAFDGGDVSGDGIPDIFLTGMRPNGQPLTGLYIFVERRVTPRPNTSPKIEAVYEQQAFVSRPLMQGSVDWVDLDGDGLEDVVATGMSVVEVTTDRTELQPFTDIYLNRDGDLNFQGNGGLPGIFDSHVITQDFDGNGTADILMAGNTGDEQTIGLYRNMGNGTSFIESQVDFGSLLVEDMTAADLTGNGLPDILLTGTDPETSAPVTRFFRNDGSGIFTEQPAPLENLYFASFTAIDLTGDGIAELVATGARPGPLLFSGSLRVLRNDGFGSFSDGDALLRDFGTQKPEVFRGSSMPGDVNGDGNTDLIIQGLSGLLADDQNEIAVYAGTGGAALVRIADMSGIFRGRIRLIDYDGNGRDDLIVMGERQGNPIAQIQEF